MGEKELVISIILINAILFIFILGIILFISQYRKRKILHKKELLNVNNNHNKAILIAQLQAQEQTMIHIGNDIHDGVGQKLTLASLYLQRMTMKQEEILNPENLKEVNQIIDEALNELRLLSKTLVNPELAQLSLIELLNLDIRRINDLGSLFVDYKVVGQSFELSEKYKNNVYRIVQEFIQNSIKHAECNKIEVELKFQKPFLEVVCNDNGKGFIEEITPKGIGLSNTKRRIEEMYGKMDFYSKINEGTGLSFKIKTENE